MSSCNLTHYTLQINLSFLVHIMEATPEFNYQIDVNPERKKIGTIQVYSSFVRPANMQPTLTRSNFSCSLPANEFTDDEDSPHKQRLYYFLKDSGVDAEDAYTLIIKLTQLACKVTSNSFEYCSRYALLLWLTLDVAPSNEYERNSAFRPASKLRVEALSRRIYKRKRKTSSIANQCKRYKRKQESSSSGDKCTICFQKLKTGQEVATLLCGHEFDNKCIMEWFKVRHNCPLCRFELPREHDQVPQLTTVF